MTDSGHPVPPSTRARLVTPRFVVIIVSGLFYFLALTMLQPVLPRYIEGPLGGGAVGVGVGVGALAVGAVLLRPAAGRLGDRIGRRPLIVGGAAIVAVTTAVYGAIGELPFLVGMRLLSGIGEAAFFVGAATMITDLAPLERRGEAVSYWSIAIYGGIAFGPVLGEAVMAQDRFTLAWVVSASLAGLAAIAGLTTRDVPREGPPPQSPRLLHRAALAPGLILFLGLIGLAGFAAFLPLYVGEIGIEDAGPVFLVYGLVVLVIRIVGARLPDQLGPVTAATGSLALIAAGLGLAWLWSSPAGLYLGTVVFALGMSLHYPALMLLALAGIADSERASVVGTFSSFFDLAQGLGALIAGLAVAASGTDAAAFATGAVAALLGLVVLRATPAVSERSATSVAESGRAQRPL